MVRQSDKQPSVLRSVDWWTVAIYVALLVFGWISVCGASYSYGDTDILSLDTRSGMQILWIGTSMCICLEVLGDRNALAYSLTLITTPKGLDVFTTYCHNRCF